MVKKWNIIKILENKGWINKIDPYGCFSGILGTGQVEDRKMIKDKLIDGKNRELV